MLYLLQDIKESDAMRIEIEELKSELDELNNNHKYKIVTSDYFINYNDSYERTWIRDNAIPVGSLEFVQAYLREFHGINHMNPIEIPKCLRLPHLLLRKYKIIDFEDIPECGFFFVKDVSRLKGWAYSGDVARLLHDRTHDKGLVQLSSQLNILSEYRICVLNNKIVGIQFYDGDPTILPNEHEINRIKEMTLRWSMQADCPKAYTLDVAVVKTDNEQGRGVALIECHPFVSVGTYGCRGAFLPMMFKLGLQWYIDHNTQIS